MEIKEYSFTESGARLIERIVDDENTNINHVVLPEGEGLPPHSTNSNVYPLALKGAAEVRLNGEPKELSVGEILAIPFGTKMELNNTKSETYEMFIIKAPAPKNAAIK